MYDLGSTFTKAAAVALSSGELMAWAKAPSTVATDVTEGLEIAVCEAERLGGFRRADARWRLAASSAAGGLRLVAVGLVPELTGEAARRAALGAGARVVRTFCYEMTGAEVDEFEALDPDLVLLTGGTDGGNRTVLLHNAERLAGAVSTAPIVLAGNKVVAEAAAATLRARGKETWIAENVLPSVGVINVEPARRAIRDVFIRRIVQAKGLDRASRYVDRVMMPTPTAVLLAAELLARAPQDGDGARPAILSASPVSTSVVVVDVGGATTDVHSVGKGDPAQANLIPKGLPEPISKRTVEGDLGMRWNALSILEAAGADTIAALMQNHLAPGAPVGEGRVQAAVAHLRHQTWRVPVDEWDEALDHALATVAVDLAVSRHAGHVEDLFTPTGRVSVVYGKDLSLFDTVIGTGGPLVSNPCRASVLRAAAWDEGRPYILKPKHPRLLIDDHYVSFAAGLLAEKAPRSARRLLAGSLRDA